MARGQNNERNPDAAWRSRYSDLPSVEEVLSQQHPRVARRRPRVNPAKRPPEPPKSTSRSDDEPPKSTSKSDDAPPKSTSKSDDAPPKSTSRANDDKREAKAGSRKAGSPKAKAGSR
jgi:hypothetical protein